MRILLVSDHYPPFIGGAHRQTRLLAQELSRRGHVVGVVTVWSKGLSEETDESGVQVFRLRQLRTLAPWLIRNPRQSHQPPIPDPVTLFGLRRIIRRMRPDVVHTYGWFSYTTAAALIGLDIPLLISVRDYGYSCATRTLVRNSEQICAGPSLLPCLQCAARYYGMPKGWTAVLCVFFGRGLLKMKANGVHSISTYVQSITRRDFLGDATQVRPKYIERIIPSFHEGDIDAGPRDEVDIQPYLDLLPTKKFILYVGALRRVKGIDLLLTAYRSLVEPPPLVLIGTLEKDSPCEFPFGVTVLRDFPHRAVMGAWERCLFGVFPSLWPEPLGSVIYEGMSRGKAVIGTKPGGHTDMIVHGETGLLVPSGDIDALTRTMAVLIAQPELCARLGTAAQHRARLFTAQVAVPQFEALYDLLLGRAGNSAGALS
jgi:glycosyltransferase involved in cell wall biosynthesis